MKELVITLYISEYRNFNKSIYEDDTCIELDDYDIETTDNVVSEVGDNYISLEQWLENKVNDIYVSGDWYLDPIDQVEIKNFRVPAKKIEGEWYINE